MVELTFDGLFRTTTKGLPDTSNLQPYSYFSMDHFVYSVIVQIIIGLILTIYTVMQGYRVVYRIKNDKVFPKKDQQYFQDPNQQKTQKQQSKASAQKQLISSNLTPKDSNPQTNDNLIYRFDQSSSENQEQNNQSKKQPQNEQQNDNVEEQKTMSQQNTRWFLKMDGKLLFFQSFLIGFVVVVNIFASNLIVLSLLGASLILFFLFNVKMCYRNVKLMQVAFTLPCVSVFLITYLEDLNMAT